MYNDYTQYNIDTVYSILLVDLSVPLLPTEATAYHPERSCIVICII